MAIEEVERKYRTVEENRHCRTSKKWIELNPDELKKYYNTFKKIEHESKLGIKWSMVIDIRKCIGCHACTVACKVENNVPEEVFRAWVKVAEKGKYPNPQILFLPRLCNHCENPPCVEVCPVRATYRREDGTVLIDQKICIGCGYCIQACPYDARFFNPISHTADKCTFCNHRLEKKLRPACVEACVGNARTFGNLDDPDSEVSYLTTKNAVQVLKEEMRTEPMVFYIGLDKDIIGRIGGGEE